MAWAIGQTWLRVPPSMKVTYHGRLRPWVTGKDLILYTIGQITVDSLTTTYYGTQRSVTDNEGRHV